MVLVVIVSTFVLTAAAWAFARLTRSRLCAVCLGVSATWLWLMAARFAGYAVDPLLPGVLLGGSVVGLTYQLERRLPPGRSPRLWKALAVPTGFALVLTALEGQWLGFLAAAVVAGVLGGCTFSSPASSPGPRLVRPAAAELERKMEDCC